MYAPPFEYARAESWPEAIDLVVGGGEEARPIAGGQSLIPMMMLGMSEPPLLVDVSKVAPRTIEASGDTVTISALVRHVELEESAELRQRFPALAEAAGWIGNIRVRHRGTIGGSLAHADPNAEYPCVTTAAGATVVVTGPEGERRIPAVDLFVTHFTTTLEPGEMVTAVELPALGPKQGCAFVELSRRAGDFATVQVCAIAELADDGTCSEARMAVGSITDRPHDLSEALDPLRGVEPEQGLLAATAAAAEMAEIGQSSHGSVEYRRHLVEVLGRRALQRAFHRARDEEVA